MINIFSLLLSLLNNAYFISYIKSKTFDLPLTFKEEQFYLQKKCNGDKAARDLLIEKNLRLVAHIAKKYNNNRDLQEDLISIGTIGLIKAIDSYSIDKKTKLATYASKCIENEILMHLRARKKTSREVSLYEPIGTDREGNEIQLFDVIETDDQEAHRKIGVIFSKLLRVRSSIGSVSFTLVKYNSALNFSCCVLIRVCPSKISPVFRLNLRI